SLTTTEGDHMRGRQLMHTAFTPNPAVQHPSLGSVAAYQIPRLPGYQEISLPNYISVGGGEGPGFLGMNYAPFNVQNPWTPPENHSTAPDARRHRRRTDGTHPPPATPVLHPGRPLYGRPGPPPGRRQGAGQICRPLQGARRNLPQGLQPRGFQGGQGL